MWTLTIEMVFYTICLLAYRWLTTTWQCIAVIAFLCFTIQTLMPLPPINSPLRGLAYVILLACPFIPVMLVGVVLSAHHRNLMSLRTTQLLVPALALTALYLMTTGRITLTTAKYNLMFTTTIAVFVAISIWGSAWRGNRGVDFFARGVRCFASGERGNCHGKRAEHESGATRRCGPGAAHPLLIGRVRDFLRGKSKNLRLTPAEASWAPHFCVDLCRSGPLRG